MSVNYLATGNYEPHGLKLLLSPGLSGARSSEAQYAMWLPNLATEVP